MTENIDETVAEEAVAVESFTNRNQTIVKVRSIDHDGTAITFTDGWSMGLPEAVRGKLEVGDLLIMEKQGFNRITGLAKLAWLYHDSDEKITAENEAWVAKREQEDQERLEKYRDEYTEREARLPFQALKDRLQRFRDAPGSDFELKGWGYELAICELAALYATLGGAETEEISNYANEYGTSGNQHDYAKVLAQALVGANKDESWVANSVSGLSPITGNPDYRTDG